MSKYYRSITIDIDATYLDTKTFEKITPGVKILSSKVNTKTNIKKINVFGSISNKDMTTFKESWNKKKQKRLTQPMFSQEFSGLQKIADKITTVDKNRSSVQHDHKYSNKKPYNPYNLYSKKTLESFDLDKIYICNMKSVHDEYLVGQIFGDNMLSLLELETLQPEQWLRNNIINAGLSILLHENKSHYRALPVQVNNNCFKNRLNITLAFESCSTSLLIPQGFGNHFYLVILNMQTKEISCLDPKKIIRNINKFTSYYLRIIWQIRNEMWSVKTMAYDKQKDSVECGIFVLQYAERYIKNLSMTGLGDKTSFRNTIRTKILQYATTDICLHCSATRHLYAQCIQCSKKVCAGCVEKNYIQQDDTSILCKLCEHENNSKALK